MSISAWICFEPEAPAKITGGGRVRDRARTERLEERDVVAPYLDVIEHAAAAQRVVRDVQDVIGLAVRTTSLQDRSCVSSASISPTFRAT